ncbi:MAG: cold shock domain-containing protein [Comamonadaceae bacterium]|nr:cold shock domain-containing protein [Comamonadaceae bacterium]
MRYEGRLAKWNAERGFGFIASADSGEDVFVHISAFPRDGRQPAVDEWLSFEVEPDGKGKKRAVRVTRAGNEAAARAPSFRRPAVRPEPRPEKRVTDGQADRRGFAGGNGLVWLQPLRHPPGLPRCACRSTADRCAHATAPSAGFFQASGTGRFQLRWPQVLQPDEVVPEATLFLQNCPGMEMDGDHDGVPCEEQWCK